MSFKANFEVWVPAPSPHNSVTLGKFLLWVPSSVRQLSWGLQEVLSDGHNVWQIVSSKFVSAICSFLSDEWSSEKVNTSFMGVSRENEPKYLRHCVLEPKAMAHQEKPLIQILLPLNVTGHQATWLKHRQATILAPLAWTYPALLLRGHGRGKSLPALSEPPNVYVGRRERSHLLIPILFQPLPTGPDIAKNLISDHPHPLSCLEEVGKDTFYHTKGLAPKERPTLGLGGWFFFFLLFILYWSIAD